MLAPLLAVLSLFQATEDPPRPTWPFKAMAYNVLYDAPAEDIEKSLEVIEKEKPDVLCLRELTPTFAKAFRKRLGKEYPHTVLTPRRGTWGMGIASRHPLLRTESFPEKPHRIPGMEADVKLGGKRMKVVCVHLMAPGAKHIKTDGLLESLEKNAKLRAKQGKALMERYANEKAPILLLGDMNEGRQADAMKTFATAGFTHSCDGPSASCGNTWPGANTALPAVVEIDHILGRGLTFSEARVLRSGGSDHFPVRALFNFR
ncbi:endonuclease/exonuclease/phosphatase family protein [Archangium lansingense]|uniref:Endonuclease/exonuclease/phosphatase family protein n=2 Tax=Archangium lansingense TaxID=2995310 RepID=A0ABT3ZVR3_9BACT|nr:endonuclease/exonuclease/phosphatase family protein [Archangium lansinium]MCY1073500.1 endonuclease/exonuclease/phosphatase family protein [Archangium lansinium]